MQIEKKREQEQQMLRLMISIYCRGTHHTNHKEGLCPQCEKLQDYALIRTQKCPFMETKTFCSACRVHCYSPQMQSEIQKVMRYAGPRMLFVHPGAAVRHMMVTIGKKRKERKNVS